MGTASTDARCSTKDTYNFSSADDRREHDREATEWREMSYNCCSAPSYRAVASSDGALPAYNDDIISSAMSDEAEDGYTS